MKNILITTGGTGGHVIPSVSLFDHLQNSFSVKIVTDKRGSKYIDENKYSYELIDVPNLFIKIYLLPLMMLKYLIIILKSINFIRRNKIDIIISTGGYMSFPFCVAATILKKNIYLFEPNSVLGKSNKIMLGFAKKIICYDSNLKNFPKKYNFKKIISYPILKKEIYKIKENRIKSNLKTKKILIIGGSQGAHFFDSEISELIIKIKKKIDLNIVQQVSKKNSLNLIKKKYDQANINHTFFEFTDKSEDIYQDVDLAITRGGANTLSELSFLKIPFIVVPLPSSKDNHQYHNANYYFQKNCCWLIEQNKFYINEMSLLIEEIFKNTKDYNQRITILKNITEKNTWNFINSNIIKIINEN